MKIYPAIDIKGGNAVRLVQGDYDQVTVYNTSPLEVACDFAAQGATNLHIVDLDGAKAGKPVNTALIKSIAALPNLFVQLGGGIRSRDTIAEYLDAGVSRVILGSAAVKDYAFTEASVAEFGDAIAVGVDAKDGCVAVSGWEEVTGVDAYDFCLRLRDTGVKTVIYTDISRDGMEMGTNMEVYRRLAEIDGLNIVASGGVTFPKEIVALRELGTYGAILGKALYTGKLKLGDVV
ncbi:MAG: 1-(5-phosphoribosyl)-5-[(5-phosphoribosylamino)methylideneamino]imidazole-4-carboxamide isomerase [Oscillospiraceae bacterium]|nr:1-(5-phosphoribosyl)-5-[(5-phosphoribosylamino)methylideneamino]imidazole-4-carboxamide isomerase [Oscillospiraceae bacterium]